MAGERRKDYMVSKRVHLLYVLTWLTSLALVGSLVAMAYTLRSASRALPEAGKTFSSVRWLIRLPEINPVSWCS